MKWYDYLFCVMLADFASNAVMDLLTTDSILWALFTAVALYGHWIMFEWYAEFRQKSG